MRRRPPVIRGQRAGDIAHPGKGDPAACRLEPGDRNGSAAGAAQARRGCNRAAWRPDDRRSDETDARLRPKPRRRPGRGPSRRRRTASCAVIGGVSAPFASTLQESPHTSSPGMAIETAPQPECDGSRCGLGLPGRKRARHGGAEARPRCDVERVRLPHHGAEPVALRAGAGIAVGEAGFDIGDARPAIERDDFDAAFAVVVFDRCRPAFRRRGRA